MSTVVFAHGHPDDEASQSAGSVARAVSEGHRVVLVVAANGDHRVAFLGYADSGMTGWAQNDHEESFARADTEEAAQRLAAVLREEAADVVVGYDWHGGYGHPDHVKVHAVTKRAAELAGTPRYLEGSMNRDAMIRSHQAAMAAGLDVGEWDPS